MADMEHAIIIENIIFKCTVGGQFITLKADILPATDESVGAFFKKLFDRRHLVNARQIPSQNEHVEISIGTTLPIQHGAGAKESLESFFRERGFKVA
jgi:hypothetical protein